MTHRKEIATTFLQAAAAGNAVAAFSRHATAGFQHHNPYFAAGARTLGEAMDANAREFPDKVLEIRRVLEDGDLVAVHSSVRMKPDGAAIAVVHLFRFEGERIAELWDVAQQEPADSPNRDGMF